MFPMPVQSKPLRKDQASSASSPARGRNARDILSAKILIATGAPLLGRASGLPNGVQSSKRASLLVSLPITAGARSEEHTSELQSLMRISYAVFCLKKKKQDHFDT